MLLNTIKMPRDMLRLKAILPEKRYKNAQSDKFKSDLSELLNNDQAVKDSIKYKEKSIKVAKSYLDLPQPVNNHLMEKDKDLKNKDRRDRNDIDLNKKQDNKHEEVSIYNSINGNQVIQSKNQILNNHNQSPVRHKPADKIIFKDELPLIVDFNVKQVNEVPKNLHSNINNHKKHNSKPILND